MYKRKPFESTGRKVRNLQLLRKGYDRPAAVKLVFLAVFFCSEFWGKDADLFKFIIVSFGGTIL